MFIHATVQAYPESAGGPNAHRVVLNFVTMINGRLKGDMENVTAVSEGDAVRVMAKVGDTFRTEKEDSSKWGLEAMRSEIEGLLREKLFE